MRFHLVFAPDEYRQWLTSFPPDTLLERWGSPLSHFIVADFDDPSIDRVGLEYEQDTPVMWLSFTYGGATNEFSGYGAQWTFVLPAWTRPLVHQYADAWQRLSAAHALADLEAALAQMNTGEGHSHDSH